MRLRADGKRRWAEEEGENKATVTEQIRGWKDNGGRSKRIEQGISEIKQE